MRCPAIATRPGTTLEDLIQLRHLTQLLPQTQPRGLSGLPGKICSRRRGHGLDFDDLRPYQPGDDVRHIDWNVTARTQQAHLRLYREEHERALTVAVDLRPCMFTGSACFRADRAVRLAALTLWQAAHQGDRCSAQVYDRHGFHSSRPAIAGRGALAALGLLAERYRHNAGTSGNSASPEISHWLARLNRSPRQAGTMVLFSSLDHGGPALAQHLPISAARGDLTVIEISDPLEHKAPGPGLYPYRQGDRSGVAAPDARAARQLQVTLQRKMQEKRAPWLAQHIPLLGTREPLTAAALLHQLRLQRVL
ncbi:DUF58 domain-containing protein [Granulosicoccaceae sp. 1_MG-2023]|nr:DUF58 domain-containing protein [Granulosicoccaceae sp. 1_MG-2023]